MTVSMQLSVIIACYNGASTLADQLDGLSAQTWSKPWEVLFVDNRSTDDSRLIAEAYMERIPSLRVIDASEKQGKAFALNKGIKHSKSERIAFADADDQVAPGWLSAMGEALAEYELVACRWDIRTLNSKWVIRYRQNNQLNDVPRIDYPPYLPHAGGGTIGIHRKLHRKIGGFDESLPHLEDTDYVWRAQLAGAKLHFEPKAVMRIRFRDEPWSIFQQNMNYAEFNVFLSKRYRKYGLPKPNRWTLFLINWWAVALNFRVPFKYKASFAKWMAQVGWQVGLFKGVLKYRVPPV